MLTPTVPFSPSTRVTVTVPAGVRSDRGSPLGRPMTAHFTTEPFSSLALADLPGQLGYLPGPWQAPNLGLQVASKLRYNVILRGAVMAFQPEHNMTVNGDVNTALWKALQRAASLGQNNV